jgi:hypothetical protein
MLVIFITERIAAMTAMKHYVFIVILLIGLLSANLLNIQVASAEGDTPTDPPPATAVETEMPVESTPEPVDTDPPVEELTATPVAEILTGAPESTEVMVLDESASPLPLATLAASEIVQLVDPMWCPAGQLPDDTACHAFDSIEELLDDMSASPADYDAHGIIYFTPTISNTDDPFVLTDNRLGNTDYSDLRGNNITLQGGWNGLTGAAASFSGQTDFGNRTITIGEQSNPWVGNIAINDIRFNAVSGANSLMVYTSVGDITLNNVDVLNQGGGMYPAILNSASGDIVVQGGSAFDGDDTNTNRFVATTGTGSITIRDTSFTDIERSGAAMYDGALLTAPRVSLINVLAARNDGNGIRVNGADLVTLQNVIASDNGTAGSGSGILVNGNPGSRLILIGGTFTGNQRYGVHVGSLANSTLYIQSAPTCTGNGSACTNALPITDSTAPVITPAVNGALAANGWYGSDVSVTWSVLDPESDLLSSSGCDPVTLTADTPGATVTCSATNRAGLSKSVSVTIKIDQTPPVLSLPSAITAEATGPTGAIIKYSASATDAVDGTAPVSCSMASGSMFPLGTTTVTCSAIDLAGNSSSATFAVTVQDTTPPTIAAHTDIGAIAPGRNWTRVSYSRPETMDAVDGAGTASCSPVSGSIFPAGATAVTCTATDSSGNSALSTFHIVVEQVKDLARSQADSSFPLSPFVEGQPINFQCNSIFWASGVRLSFMNLCDRQTAVHGLSLGDLPAELPDGMSYAAGLVVDLLVDGERIETLPAGAGIQLDFPAAGDHEYAVLYWDESQAEWVEISAELSQENIAQVVQTGDEMYHLVNGSLEDAFCQVLTTARTGVFVLVKK